MDMGSSGAERVAALPLKPVIMETHLFLKCDAFTSERDGYMWTSKREVMC